MTVGIEWLIEAYDCDAEALRSAEIGRRIFDSIVEDCGLKTVGESTWHKFPGEGGITGFVILTESHIACHTYPEYKMATFNLYCCTARPVWDWEKNLKEFIKAGSVVVRTFTRGVGSDSKAVGGEA